LFAWCTNQQFFADLSNVNIKGRLHEEQMRQIEEEQLPDFLAGHVDVDQGERRYVENGTVWSIVER
jgi:hypothetical protein